MCQGTLSKSAKVSPDKIFKDYRSTQMTYLVHVCDWWACTDAHGNTLTFRKANLTFFQYIFFIIIFYFFFAPTAAQLLVAYVIVKKKLSFCPWAIPPGCCIPPPKEICPTLYSRWLSTSLFDFYKGVARKRKQRGKMTSKSKWQSFFPIKILSVAPIVGKHLTSSEIDSHSSSPKLKLGNKNGCKETK